MATSYKKTTVQSFPRVGEKCTRDTEYWGRLEAPITKKEHAAVTHIDFSPTDPYNYAVTSSARVLIYGNRSNQVVRSLTKFKEIAHCGSYRSDGRLLVAGGDEPIVRLYDIAGKGLLRMFRGHKGPVHVTKFLSDNLHIMSGSDDNSVAVWDIATEKRLNTFAEHTDYVRCGTVSQASNDIILTGSYDHTIRLYDVRTGASVLSVEHGQPVESVVMFPAGGAFISAGGNTVKVWDALAGGRLLASFTNHHKTVTSLCFCSNHQRLMSAGLDRHVKVYDVSCYQLVHTLDFPASILSLGVAPDDSCLAVGMSDGLLSVQRRRTDTPDTNGATEKRRERKRASYKYTLHTTNYTPTQDDHVVGHKRKEHLAKYDRYFKQFAYTKALDAAIDLRVRMKTPEVTVSVLRELMRRGGLASSLAGRDDKSLDIIIRFIQKHVSSPKFMTTLVDVTDVLLSLYSDSQSPSIHEVLVRLQLTVRQEVNYMKQLYELMGTLDTLFSASQTKQQQQDGVENVILEPMADMATSPQNDRIVIETISQEEMDSLNANMDTL